MSNETKADLEARITELEDTITKLKATPCRNCGFNEQEHAALQEKTDHVAD